MDTRHVSAYGSSMALHVLVAATAVWLASAGVQPVSTGEARKAMPVFVVPPEDPALPGLNQVDESQDASIRRSDASPSEVAMRGFTFDIQKVSARATLLFPFLTPGLSLERLAQASLDALATLLDVDPTRDLLWTRDANRGAYDLLVDVRRFYSAQLTRKHPALDPHQHPRTTPHGYRAGDARFLIGAIYWNQHHTADALDSWRDITIEPMDSYATAYSGILAAIGAPRLDSHRIELILRAEHGRWIMFSMDRLLQFGYHFDTF